MTVLLSPFGQSILNYNGENLPGTIAFIVSFLIYLVLFVVLVLRSFHHKPIPLKPR
jgi:hypothetical protein